MRWVATELVDPSGERSYPKPARYQHWIQAKLTRMGLLRYPKDNPRLTLDEIEIWHQTGWDPEPVVVAFQSGFRRPWESLFDPAVDGPSSTCKSGQPISSR